VIQRFAEQVRHKTQQQSLIANPKTLQDVSLMLLTLMDMQEQNESLFIIGSIFQCFERRPVNEWGRLLEILLILFEKGDDRMHVSFHLCLEQLLRIHTYKGVSQEIRLKCLQVLYLAIKTINWTDITAFTPSKQDSEKLERFFSEWLLIMQHHLQSHSQAHSFFIFKIVNEIFKDQKSMTQMVANAMLPSILASFTHNLKKYLSSEVFHNTQPETEFQKDMESFFEYTLDEDQHYANLTQAIVIKFIDLVQDITFNDDPDLTLFLSNGSCFLVQVFFALTMMNQEDLFLWNEEPNQYIQDDEDESNLYAIKPAVVSCLYSLIERFPKEYTQPIVDLGDFYIQRFVSVIRLVGVGNVNHLFNPQSQIYSDPAKCAEIHKFLTNYTNTHNTQVFQKISEFIQNINPQISNQTSFLTQPDHLFSGLPLPQHTFNSFVEHWKKMECTLFLTIDFIKDIITLHPHNETKLNEYAKVCSELLNAGISDVLTGRAIWAISTLKNFSSSDEEFLNIYLLVCRFLSPECALSVRLCASRTITRMSFKIASEKKQSLVAEKIGEKMRELHVWVIELMGQADEKTYNLIIDNLVSFYDICPGLLTQEFRSQYALLFLKAFGSNIDNGLLSACFIQLFKKIGGNVSASSAFWPHLVDLFNSLSQEALLGKFSNQIQTEHKLENLSMVLNLISYCGISFYLQNNKSKIRPIPDNAPPPNHHS
jgi:hypothetical protein